MSSDYGLRGVKELTRPPFEIYQSRGRRPRPLPTWVLWTILALTIAALPIAAWYLGQLIGQDAVQRTLRGPL